MDIILLIALTYIYLRIAYMLSDTLMFSRNTLKQRCIGLFMCLLWPITLLIIKIKK